ncbi:hypothetical protein BDZ91DRAFT_760035 [Kalaharituber pfeilii]|nr:hypothetical protein BDZ91DRAFT_760035 [Kalaharituber pfeilii]
MADSSKFSTVSQQTISLFPTSGLSEEDKLITSVKICTPSLLSIKSLPSAQLQQTPFRLLPLRIVLLTARLRWPLNKAMPSTHLVQTFCCPEVMQAIKGLSPQQDGFKGTQAVRIKIHDELAGSENFIFTNIMNQCKDELLVENIKMTSNGQIDITAWSINEKLRMTKRIM